MPDIKYSIKGYKSSSPDKDKPYNVIPSGRITMKGVPHPVIGIDDLGNTIHMTPDGEYQFPGQSVFEIPLKDNTMEKGGKFWDGDKWVGTGDNGTYSNGTYFKKGGPAPHHKGKGKKLTPQQMQMMMQAMQGQQQPGQQGPPPPGMPPMGAGPGMPSANQPMMQGMPPAPGQDPNQMMPPGQASPGGMKTGGIHIKKSHEGKFTEYKKRTGKTTEEALHSKDPHVRQMANFARNAAKWHHETGGHIMQDGGMTQGNTVFDINGQVLACGGMVNPYHPLAKFLRGGVYQEGGQTPVTSDNPMEGAMSLPDNNNSSSAWAPAESNYNPSTDNNNPVNNPANKPIMNADDSQNSPSAAQPQQAAPAPTPTRRPLGAANWGLGILGAGMSTVAAYSSMRDARNNQAYMRSLGTSDNFQKTNQPGGHGDYDQQGTFRPDQNTPTRAGLFYSKMQMGGRYSAGQELEVDDKEVARLRALGYKFDIL